MNQQEFETNIDEMIADIISCIKPECMKLYNYNIHTDNDTTLSKAIMYAVLSNLVIRYSPLSSECGKLVKKYRPFI